MRRNIAAIRVSRRGGGCIYIPALGKVWRMGRDEMDENSNQELDPAEEQDAAKAGARRFYRGSCRKAIYSTVAFFLSCCSVIPFLYGHSLHEYWDVLGKYLVMLSMGLLLPFLYFSATVVNAWIYKRNIEDDAD
jgi:hypothetical protein